MKMQRGTDYIYQLIKQGEHQQQDFKFEISDARKIAKSLSAFSNTDGGRLLVGVKDNGKIAGVRSEEEIYMIEAAAKLYSKPEIHCNMHLYEIEGHQVLEVVIPKGESAPYYAKDENNHYKAYIRIKDENILATPVQPSSLAIPICTKRSFCTLFYSRTTPPSFLKSKRKNIPDTMLQTDRYFPSKSH